MRLFSIVLGWGLVAAAAPCLADVALENKSKATIEHVFVSPAGQDKFSADKLSGEDESIEPGDTAKLAGLEPACYDVKLVFEDGGACLLPDLALADDKTFIVTDAALETCSK